MHDVMNNASSHNANFDQFHIMASYTVTLPCFIYKMELKKHCLGGNLDGLPNIIETSLAMIQ
jgi:hypothetical protein